MFRKRGKRKRIGAAERPKEPGFTQLTGLERGMLVGTRNHPPDRVPGLIEHNITNLQHNMIQIRRGTNPVKVDKLAIEWWQGRIEAAVMRTPKTRAGMQKRVEYLDKMIGDLVSTRGAITQRLSRRGRRGLEWAEIKQIKMHLKDNKQVLPFLVKERDALKKKLDMMEKLR